MITQNATARAIVVLALAGCAAPVAAQAFQQNDYNVTHSFTFTAATSATVIDVTVYDFRHAWARGVFADANYVSATQLPDFDPFGTDTFGSPTSLNSGLLAVPVACQYDTYTVPPTGLSAFACTFADGMGAMSVACNEWDIDPFPSPPYVIQGTIASSGGATATTSHTPASESYAFSSNAVTANGGIQLANGTIQWGLSMDSDAVGGGAGARARVRRADPVHFIATNLSTGAVVDAVLLEIDLDVRGPGTADWTGGVFEALADDVHFVVSIPGTYVAPHQSGYLQLRIEQGIVTAANDGGLFTGVLPPVGTTVPFSFPLPQSFQLDYDLGLDPAHPWDVTAILSGGAGTNPAIRCLADLNADGVLNVDDVDAFVGLFLEGSLGADINGDGVLNVDDVDAFVAAFLTGCDPDNPEG